MSTDFPSNADLRTLLNKIHDEAASALASGTPQDLDAALSNIIHMARYKFDGTSEQDQVRKQQPPT